ncbi:interleukin-2 receptor subunit beta [Pelodytes ibericus]
MADHWCSLNHLLALLYLQSAVLGDLNCTYNAFDVISCTWKAEKTFTSTECFIKADKLKKDKRMVQGFCWLPTTANLRQCKLPMTNKRNTSNVLTVSDVLNITVTCSSGRDANNSITSLFNYRPFSNIRLDPPQSLEIKMTQDGLWNLSWVFPSPHYVKDKMEYEVFYKRSKDSWKNATIIPIRQNDHSVCLRSLQPDTIYEAQVRVNQTEFPGGMWSDNSQAIQWRTLPQGTATSTSLILIQTVPACIAVLVFIVLVTCMICYSDRFKKILWVGVPDPSRFFDPLIFTYKGDFQKWISSPFDFSAISLDPTPLDISPVDINWNKDKCPPKLISPGLNETPIDNSGHSQSSFSNQGYFFFQFPTIKEEDSSSDAYFSYGCVEQRIPPVLQNIPLPSPAASEETPLFHADYLRDTISVGIGVQNRSFEVGPLSRSLQSDTLDQEKINIELNCEEFPEVPFCPFVERMTEKQKTEECDSLNDMKSPQVPECVHPTFQECDMTGGYFSLSALYQQNYCHWV